MDKRNCNPFFAKGTVVQYKKLLDSRRGFENFAGRKGERPYDLCVYGTPARPSALGRG